MTSNSVEVETSYQHHVMGLIGAAAGLAMFVLFEVLGATMDNQRLLLWIASGTLGFFILLFALRGSLGWRDAVLGAAVLALADAALLYWASDRFIQFDDLFEESFAPVAWGMVLFIGAPFTVALLKGRTGDYGLLFDTAWNIVVRYVAAWIFVGLFWGLLHLSDALLSIVGITIIEELIDFDPMPYVLTGGALGLGLSVAQDLRAYVSPYLPLRLLRLLLPMVLVVVTIFILALPFRGLSQLFGDFSAAGILMSVTIAGITLVTSALDKNEAEGIHSLFMGWVTRALALLLPVLSGLAVWALWLRVVEYGWTPERVAASLAALLVMGYATLYGLAVFQGTAWRGMIRQANTGMALTIMVLAAFWMTPLMNAQKISAQNQIDRYMAGLVNTVDLPAWELANAWGKAGLKVVAQLKVLEGDDQEALLAHLQKAEEQSRWEFNRNRDKPSRNQLAAELATMVQVWPEEHSLPEGYFGTASRWELGDWIKMCGKDIDRRCVLVFGPFLRQGTEVGMFFIPQSGGGAKIYQAGTSGDTPEYFAPAQIVDGQSQLTEDQYRQLSAGGYRIGPATRQSLWLGGVEISPNN